MARRLGVAPSTLYRNRRGTLLLTAERATRLREMALAIAQEMNALAYALTKDVQEGRLRAYRQQVRKTDRLTTMRRWPARGGTDGTM
jgi:hypothetical protein